MELLLVFSIGADRLCEAECEEPEHVSFTSRTCRRKNRSNRETWSDRLEHPISLTPMSDLQQIRSQIRRCATHVVLRNLFRGAKSNHFAAFISSSRTDVDDPVARGNDIHVVLHHKYGVALATSLQLCQEPANIRRM